MKNHIFRSWALCLFILVTIRANPQSGNILTLSKCFELIKENPQVARLKFNSEISEVNIEQLKANRIPSLSSNISQNINFGRSIDPFSNQYIQRQIFSNNFSLNSSVVLFNGFQNNRLIDQNNHLYLANEYATKKLINDLAMNAANTYFDILMSQEQLSVLAIQLESTDKRLEKTSKQISQGLAVQADFLLVQAQQISEKNNILNLKSRILISKNNLCQLLNIPFDSSLTISLDGIPLSVENLAFNKTLDTENFPQIQESNERIKAAYYSYLVSKGAQAPRLTLNAGITTLYSNQNKEAFGAANNKTVLTGFLNNDPAQPVYLPTQTYDRRTVSPTNQFGNNLSQFINLQLQIPIFTNKTISSSIKRAAINQNIANSNKEIARKQLETDYNQILINYSNSVEKFKNGSMQLDYRKQYFETMGKRYESGISDLYALLIEKNNLINIETEQTRLKYEVLFYKTILEFYSKGVF